MNHATNPFHTLYLTEGVEAVDMPALFSPILVPHVEQLFLPGNVELKGMQGTGKSMLLSLLDTSVRLQFWGHQTRREGHPPTDDPVPPGRRGFIGTDINLSKSNAFQLRGIKLSKDPEENIQLACQCFADFVNCWLLKELFASIHKLITELQRMHALNHFGEIGLTNNLQKLDSAVTILSKDPRCLILFNHNTYEELRNTIKQRLVAYKRLITNPRNRLSSDIENTRNILGEPISAATDALREAGVIEKKTSIFVTLDQFETLERKAPYPGDDDRIRRFVRVVDELISGRDSTVSYRIGTRPNTCLHLSEAARDYIRVDLDAILQKKESGRKGRNDLFYQLAADVFVRRLISCKRHPAGEVRPSAAALRNVFGASPKTAERGRQSASKKPDQVVKIEGDWPTDVATFLRDLARTDPISARLGEAWVRQRLAGNEKVETVAWREPSGPPWMSKDKKWWKKERLPLAALQVAARNGQRLLYYGDGDIVQLAGENILVFVTICREIWECDARYRRADGDSTHGHEVVLLDRNRQSEGIREASRTWREKIRSCPDGDTLQRFMDTLGRKLHLKLIGDNRMSYPGANGITLARHDYEAAENLDIRRLLDAATAEGFLLKRDHTPKNAARGKSIKWYPHPVFAPYYELTVPHTKEPLYISGARIRSWLKSTGITSPHEHPETSVAKLQVTSTQSKADGTRHHAGTGATETATEKTRESAQLTFRFDEVD